VTSKFPVGVRLERPQSALSVIMNDIRLWLDSHKIEPVEFKTVPLDGGSIAFDIRFQSQEEASLFKRAFA
jgi:hypothetical protein